MEVKDLTIKNILDGYRKGDFTPSEIAAAYRQNIEEKNSNLHAFLDVFDDVDEQTKKLSNSPTSNLHGVPIVLKDNILLKDHVASSGSKILENYRAPYDATVTRCLRDEGAIFMGRTNMDEFAMGSSTENSAYGPTKNPHDTTRVPGGSSGGSAVAVAAGMVPAALGSETGGSVRQPAALCGVVGLKPTYGAVSRYGLMALGSSLDQISPFAHSVEDIEILFNAIKGNDPLDSTSLPDSVWAQGSQHKTQDFTIGVPWKMVEQEGIDDDVLENFKQAIEVLKKEGCRVVDIDLPHAHYSLAVYYVILPAEVSSNMARYDGVKFGLHVDGDDMIDDYFKTRAAGFGAEVRRRIILGTYVLSSGYYDAYYYKAAKVRNLITQEFVDAFKNVDVIATPTTPTPAFKLGERTDDPLAMYLADIFTVPANIANIPAISIPSGSVEREGKDLPLGLQLMAPHVHESTLFALGKTYERAVS